MQSLVRVVSSKLPFSEAAEHAVGDLWRRALVTNERASEVGPRRGRGFFTPRYGVFHGAEVWPASCLM